MFTPACLRAQIRRTSTTASGLPVSLDLLDRYNSLVQTGKIKYDADQIRIVMQLRRLTKSLDGYAPPALSWRLLDQDLNPRLSKRAKSAAWWLYDKETEQAIDQDDDIDGAIVRVKSHLQEIEALTTPKGMMLIGPPGSGKSFLVDLWFSSLSTPYKIRRHYNELVLEVYRAVWEETQRRMTVMYNTPIKTERRVPWTKSIKSQWRTLVSSGSLPNKWALSSKSGMSGPSGLPDPTIAFTVARRLLLNHWLLVFDEIQLLDVSSATLLGDVLSWYWRLGGVVVATSNKVPDDLYKQGVSRERLEPFVESLKMRCPVLHIQAQHDWRHVRGETKAESKTWFLSHQSDAFDAASRNYSSGTEEPKSETLQVFGRLMTVPWATGQTCKFDFADLCNELYGPADYLTLASNYSTLILTSIPILKLSDRDQARRFISLIDALYEARCKLVCSAQVEPSGIFFPEAAASREDDSDIMMIETVADSRDVYRPNVSSYQSPQMAQEPAAPAPIALNQLSIFSGEDEQFAFKRALSRLIEMTSADYHEKEVWAPLPLAARKWEGESATMNMYATRPVYGPASVYDAEDFADEASYAGTLTPREVRPEAPKLLHDHVWGVREDWGPKAKSWGKGASAYEKKK